MGAVTEVAIGQLTGTSSSESTLVSLPLLILPNLRTL